jgi:hypothetical protein
MAESIRPFAPHLSFLPFALDDLVEEVRLRWFDNIREPLPVFFVDWDPLACTVTKQEGGAYRAVYVHQVLNHPGTPIEVLQGIAKHELLHRRIPGRFVADPDERYDWIHRQRGRFTYHPPEFWAEEQFIAPEMGAVWEWLWANLGACMYRAEPEGIHLTGAWRHLELSHRTPWHEEELHLRGVYEWERRKRRRRRTPRPPKPVQGRLLFGAA